MHAAAEGLFAFSSAEIAAFSSAEIELDGDVASSGAVELTHLALWPQWATEQGSDMHAT